MSNPLAINYYADKIRTLYAQNTTIDQLVTEENRKELTVTERGAGATFQFQKLPKRTTAPTALTANTAESPTGSSAAIAVHIAAAEYGQGTEAEIIPWSMYNLRAVAGNEVENKINVVGKNAATGVDYLGLTHVINTIGGGTNAAYTHPLGPNDLGGGTMGFADPKVSKLLRYGTQAGASYAARTDITSSNNYSHTWFRRQRARILDNLAVVPIMESDIGSPIFALMAHEFVLTDWLESLKLDDFPTVTEHISRTRLAERGIGIGVMGLIEGCLVIQNNNMKYAAGGAGGIDVFPVTMMSGNFLGKPYAPPSQLPDAKEGGDKYEIPEGAAVYVEPYGSLHGKRQGAVSWYAYLGYGIFDPLSCHRLEVSSTTGGTV